MDEFTEIKEALLSIAKILGPDDISPEQVQIIDRGLPHSIGSLPKGKMAIYIFKYGDIYLKIGKVGTKSNARFISQHYHPISANSNLAKSILADDEFGDNVSADTIKEWMMNNLNRIDILVNENLGIFALDLFEMCLHYKYKPKYEGFKKQTYFKKN